jgi:hypothetical protein
MLFFECVMKVHGQAACRVLPAAAAAAAACVSHNYKLNLQSCWRPQEALQPLTGMLLLMMLLLLMLPPFRQHYIPHRKADWVNGQLMPRAARRVSLTFRQVRAAAAAAAATAVLLQILSFQLTSTALLYIQLTSAALFYIRMLPLGMIKCFVLCHAGSCCPLLLCLPSVL